MAVYFAESCGFVKIGYSHNPLSRAKTITRSGIRPAGIPFGAEANLIGWIPGDVWRERALHVEHIDDRVAGEWFSIDVDHVRDLIWQDPAGVDIKRMTAASVFTLMNSPEGVTRADVEAAGVQIDAQPLAESLARMSLKITEAIEAAS